MMLELIRLYQLDIMLMMSSVCAAIAFFAAISKTASPRRKRALVLLELSCTALLVADRFVYIYNGDTSTAGFWMMRICNFEVYLFALVIAYAFVMYLSDVCVSEGWSDAPPKRLKACVIILAIGTVLLISSQFTGLYYTFDESNHYERAPGFIICYIAPAAVYAIVLTVVLQNLGKMRRIVRVPLLLFTIGPIFTSIFQAFTPWVSVNNIGVVVFCIFLYTLDLVDLNNRVKRAHQVEIELSQAREQEVRLLFEQTAAALASAIDEKDAYTQGHSARVATYARRIAERAGKSDEICDEVYYAGLLHDVGKIGIPDAIINKNEKLTDEEYETIKAHPVKGDRILASIEQSPYLRLGARYHHERYDGNGYPDGLAGEEIPEIARIIAVADSYDAMTSKRSYRGIMPQEQVRSQIESGLGTQFDPEFGRIMLQLIDEDSAYDMHEPDEPNKPDEPDDREPADARSRTPEGLLLALSASSAPGDIRDGKPEGSDESPSEGEFPADRPQEATGPQPKTPAKRRIAKPVKIALIIVFALVCVFCIGSYAVDRHLLAQTYARSGDYYPLALNDVDIADDYPMQDVQFTLDGQTLRGHVYGADNAQGLVVLRHGIFSQHEDYLAFVTALVDRGWKVFAYDAIGCGESDGDSVIGFAQSPLDVRAAVRFADESGMADGMPIMLLGHSWGGYGVAGALDFEDVRERVSACVAMSGFDTPTKIIMETSESFAGPVAITQTPFIELIGHQDFGSNADRSASQAISASNLPVLVIHGSGDDTIDYDGCSIIAQRESITNPNVSYITKSEPGRDGHNTYFYSPDSLEYLTECNARLEALRDRYDGDVPQDVLDEFMASVDKRRANVADPTLIDEIDGFFLSALDM